jgi:hypothetical protein
MSLLDGVRKHPKNPITAPTLHNRWPAPIASRWTFFADPADPGEVGLFVTKQ